MWELRDKAIGHILRNITTEMFYIDFQLNFHAVEGRDASEIHDNHLLYNDLVGLYIHPCP